MALLEVAGLDAGPVPPPTLRGLSFALDDGEALAVLGRDGAGKSTLARTLAGVLAPLAGSMVVGGEQVTALGAIERVRRRLVAVPQGRRLFPDLSVRDNLRAGAWTRREDPGFVHGRLRRCLRCFPALERRLEDAAGGLPLPEQQMAAIARALMADPRVLVVDEPSWGLPPIELEEVLVGVRHILESGVALVLLDRHVGVLDLADRALVLRDGSVAYNGPAGDLRRASGLRRDLLGAAPADE